MFITLASKVDDFSAIIPEIFLFNDPHLYQGASVPSLYRIESQVMCFVSSDEPGVRR